METWPTQIDAVTAAQIQDAAKVYLNPDAPRDIPPVSGVLMPKAKTQESAE